MCGIVTLIARTPSGFYHSDVGLLETLLVLDGQFRGLDGTGVFQVQRNQQIYGAKIASVPHDLFRTDEWPKFTQRMVNSSRIVVGHNRKATQGAINSDNSHPFNEGKITLVHNGTLTGSHKHMADVDVDSHAICHALAEADDAKPVLADLRGAFALVWWDADKQKLHAIRNKERPLFIVTTRSYHIVLSESWMAESVLKRINVGVESTKTCTPGELHTFSLDGTYTTETVKLHEEVTHNHHYYGNGGTRYQGNAGRAHHGTTSTTTRGATSETTTTGQACSTNFGGELHSDDLEGVLDVPTRGDHRAALLLPNGSSESVTKQFPKGDLIMVKFSEMSRVGDRWKLSGQTLEPGKIAVDVYGFIPISMASELLPEYLSGRTLAKVHSHYIASVCGPSIYVENIQLDLLWPTHSPGGIGSVEWAWVVDNCKCSVCEKNLDPMEHEFTSVKRTGINTQAAYKVVCPDCVADKLKEANKEIYDDFVERRIGAMEDRESVRRESGPGLILIPGGASTATVH